MNTPLPAPDVNLVVVTPPGVDSVLVRIEGVGLGQASNTLRLDKGSTMTVCFVNSQRIVLRLEPVKVP